MTSQYRNANTNSLRWIGCAVAVKVQVSLES
jgi:hypothetical protein